MPTRSPRTLATEIASHLVAIVFVPFLFHVPLPWPSAMLERAEPFLYAGLFACLHSFIKLVTFYASLEGQPVRRSSSLSWWGAAFLSVGIAYLGALGWRAEAEGSRLVVSEEARYLQAGRVYAKARPVAEGATFSGSLSGAADRALGLHVAQLPNESGAPEYSRVYLTVTLSGDEERVYETSVSLPSDGWGEVRVPSRWFPPHAERFEIRWTRKSEPNWQRLLGLQPIVYNVPESPGAVAPAPARILISGPNVYRENPGRSRLNFLVIVVDGLAAGHVSMLGYAREVTPALDRLGYGGLVFPNAYAPARAPVSALRSLLTGSLRESGGAGVATSRTVVQLLQDQDYATAAFLGGEFDDRGTSIVNTTLPEGFELVNLLDPLLAAPTEDAGGSRITLENARSWISAHSDVSFFCLVRLRELEEPRPHPRYEEVFPDEGGRRRDVDVFDNALIYLDRQIGSLLKYIRDRETQGNTCIIVTSSYGYDFSLGPSGKRFEGRSERVPLIIHVPGGRKRRRPERAAIADIAATVAGLAGVDFDGPIDGRDLLR